MIPYITDKTLAKRSTTLNVADDSVHVVATSRHGGKTVQCDWTFSFKNCTPEMRLELMKSSAVIRQQARFEKLPVADIEAACRGVVDVSTLFERTARTPQAPEVAVVSAWSKLTQEQKIAFLRENGIEGEPAE